MRRLWFGLDVFPWLSCGVACLSWPLEGVVCVSFCCSVRFLVLFGVASDWLPLQTCEYSGLILTYLVRDEFVVVAVIVAVVRH